LATKILWRDTIKTGWTKSSLTDYKGFSNNFWFSRTYINFHFLYRERRKYILKKFRMQEIIRLRRYQWPLPANFGALWNFIKDFAFTLVQTIKKLKILCREWWRGKARLLSNLFFWRSLSKNNKKVIKILKKTVRWKKQMLAFKPEDSCIHDIRPQGLQNVYAQTLALYELCLRLVCIDPLFGFNFKQTRSSWNDPKSKSIFCESSLCYIVFCRTRYCDRI